MDILHAVQGKLEHLLEDLSSSTTGICLALYAHKGYSPKLEINGYAIVYYFSKTWPDHSGEAEYPIPGGRKAFTELNLWGGEQAEHRISLMNHIISEIENTDVTYKEVVTDYESFVIGRCA